MGKGVNGNLISSIDGGHILTPEEKRKGTINGNKTRAQRKKIADILRSVLDEQLPDNPSMTRGEAFVIKCLTNAYKKGSIKDLSEIQKMLGEQTERVIVDGGGLNIIVDNSEQANRLEEIL